VQVSDEAVAHDKRRVEPPLRRWAAARALRNDPARLEELLACADVMAPRHRDALLHGLLDAADGLDAGQCRQLVGRALRSGIARVRKAARAYVRAQRQRGWAELGIADDRIGHRGEVYGR
jgi:hypothetical protein